MSHSAQYLSWLSPRFSPFGTACVAPAGLGETVCIRICLFRLTFLSAL